MIAAGEDAFGEIADQVRNDSEKSTVMTVAGGDCGSSPQ
jgi:hypothetical protein